MLNQLKYTFNIGVIVPLGNLMGIAKIVLFLCGDKAGFITGENVCIDGTMTK